MILLRKGVRDLRAMGMRAVLFLGVIGVGAGTAAGISLALHDVRETRDSFHDRYGLADVDVRLRRPVASSTLLRRARALKATAAEPRLILDGTARLRSGDEPAAEVVGMSTRARLNRLAVVEGRPLSSGAPTGALLEADFARGEDLGIGDRLRLSLAGRDVGVRIRGLVRSPEYLLATVNPDYLIPQRGSLAVLFLPRDSLQRLVGVGDRANDLAASFAPGTPERRQVRLADGLSAARVIPRSEQYSVQFTNADINSFSVFAPVMGAVFALVGLLLITLSLRRLVHSQRRELGAMLALGYSRRAVVVTVMLPAAMLAVGGAALAALVTVAIGRLVAHEYATTVGFPETTYTFAAQPLLMAAGFALAATLLATIAPAWSLARLRPSEAMRGEAITSFELPPWLERITARGGLAATYGVRTLLRRPLLTAATVISMAAAIGMGAALNILVTSTNESVDATFADQGWSYSADLSPPLPLAEAASVGRRAGASRSEAVVKGFASLRSRGGRTTNIQLTGLAPGSRLRRLDITAGDAPGRGRMTLSEQSAARLGVGTGDRLTLRTTTARATVLVAGTVRTLAGNESFLPRRQAARLLDLRGRATGVLVGDGPRVAKRLRGNPRVARVTAKAEAQDGMRELMKELTGVINTLLAISLGVGAVFLVSSLALSYLDRQGEFATLRALGYGRRQIASVVVSEALVQAGGAAVLSVPAGLLIVLPLWQRIGDAWFRIGLYPQAPNFLIVIVPALVLALLAAAQAARRVLRLNIASTVRARLIG